MLIGDAKQESINTILEMAEHKKDAKCKVLVAAGCLAHRYQDEIIKEIPEVDAFVGTSSELKLFLITNPQYFIISFCSTMSCICFYRIVLR